VSENYPHLLCWNIGNEPALEMRILDPNQAATGTYSIKQKTVIFVKIKVCSTLYVDLVTEVLEKEKKKTYKSPTSFFLPFI